MDVLDYKESWAPKNWCFWTVVLEKTLEMPWTVRKIQPVHPKGNQSWIFIERIDAKAEISILWPPDMKTWLIWKDPDAGKEGDDRGWDGWMASPTKCTWVWVHSRSWWTRKPGMLQSWGCKVSDTTEWLNWTELMLEAVALSLDAERRRKRLMKRERGCMKSPVSKQCQYCWCIWGKLTEIFKSKESLM